MRENKLEKYLTSQLSKIGVSTRKVKWIGRDGAPDRLILANGGIWVELKAPGKKPRANQKIELEALTKAGMTAYCIDSIEQIDELIGEIRGNTSGV